MSIGEFKRAYVLFKKLPELKNKINEQNLIKEFLTVNEVKISDEFYKRWWSKKSIIARKKQMELLKK